MGVATTQPTDSRAVIPECRESLCTNLSWLLGQASFALGSEINGAFAGLGVSPRGHFVLEAALGGEYTQSELADTIGLDKTTMVVTVDELEAAGLAERRPSATDRRARVIVVTPKGKRAVTAGREVIDRVQADVLSVLPARERKVFLDALSELVRTRLSGPSGCTAPARRKQPR